MTEFEVKRRLLNHADEKAKLRIIESRITESWINFGVKGISYDTPRTSETFKFNSQTENDAIDHMTEYDDLIKRQARQERIVLEIDIALDRLTEKDRQLIDLKYGDGYNSKTWEAIADSMGYCKKQAQRRHCKVITRITKLLE